MTYEERTRMIFEFLSNKGDGLLRRYSQPEHLSEDRAREEINDMVEDINADIPEAIGEASLQILLGKVPKAVRRRHGARTWPPIKVLLASVSDGLQEIENINGDAGDVESRMVDRLAEWFKKHGGCMPSCGSPTRTAALVDRGVMSAREALDAGFPMTEALERTARDMPRCANEIKREARIYSRIWDCTPEEAVERLVDAGRVSKTDDIPDVLRRVMG